MALFFEARLTILSINILGWKPLKGDKEAFMLEGTVIKEDKSVELGFEL